MKWNKQREKRNQKFRELRKKGLSYAKIAELFGLSGEGVRKALDKKKVIRNQRA